MTSDFNGGAIPPTDSLKQVTLAGGSKRFGKSLLGFAHKNIWDWHNGKTCCISDNVLASHAWRLSALFFDTVNQL
jgi:hypothetical protein